MHDADAHGGDDGPPLDFAGHVGKRRADLFGDGQRPLARGVEQHRGEFLAAQTAEQVDARA